MTDQTLPAEAPRARVVAAPSSCRLMDPSWLDRAQRAAKFLIHTAMFPDHLRKGGIEQATANAVMVLNIAERLNEDELTVAQSVYFVGGKPGWETKYLVSRANTSGKLAEPIRYKIKGEGDDMVVTAFTKLTSGASIEATVSMAMAKADGWTKNPKYKSMPDHMLCNRAATFLIRRYMPEVIIGVPATVDELEDGGLVDVTPIHPASDLAAEGGHQESAPIEDAEEVVEPEPDKVTDDEPEAKQPEEQEAPKTQETANAPDLERFEALVAQIKDDLLDGGADAVQEMYGDLLPQIEAAAPNLHKDLMAAFEAKRKAEAGG